MELDHLERKRARSNLCIQVENRAAALAVAWDHGRALVGGHARGCGGAAGPEGMQLRWRMDGRSPIKLRLHMPGGKRYAQTAAFG